jgi:anaerobic selenocysteine-containing dehydrogenase
VVADMVAAAPRVVVMMGGGPNMQTRGAYSSIAVHALAGLLGAIDEEGGVLTGRSARVAAVPAIGDYQDDVAKATAGKADARYAARIAFTKAGLDHTRSMVEIRALMQQSEDKPKEREAIYAEVLKKWAAWETLAQTFPPHAINTKRLGFDPSASQAEPEGKKSSNRRIMGFHPEAPLSKRALREMLGEGLDLE